MKSLRFFSDAIYNKHFRSEELKNLVSGLSDSTQHYNEEELLNRTLIKVSNKIASVNTYIALAIFISAFIPIMVYRNTLSIIFSSIVILILFQIDIEMEANIHTISLYRIDEYSYRLKTELEKNSFSNHKDMTALKNLIDEVISMRKDAPRNLDDEELNGYILSRIENLNVLLREFETNLAIPEYIKRDISRMEEKYLILRMSSKLSNLKGLNRYIIYEEPGFSTGVVERSILESEVRDEIKERLIALYESTMKEINKLLYNEAPTGANGLLYKLEKAVTK